MSIGPDTILRIVLTLVVFFLSLSVHEYAHARVAYALGDDTAARQGRMTLSPLSHIDFFGTILIPIIGSLTSFSLIGWAKPVPVNPVYFSRRFSMRGGMALVAAAGPASNFVLAFFSVFLLWLVTKSGIVPEGLSLNPVIVLLSLLIISNIGLGIFNLLPIPPLDGSRLMPRSLDGVMEVVQRYSFVLFLLIIFFGRRILTGPVVFLVDLLSRIFGVGLRFS